MSGIDKIVEYALEESKIDYVGLWQVCGWVGRIFRPEDPISSKRLVLEAVRAFLRSGLRPIQYSSSADEYLPWPEKSPEDVIRRISDEWAALGHDLQPGDILWFDNPRVKSGGSVR